MRGGVQQTQDQLQARGVLRLDLAVTSRFEVFRQAFVLEALDHSLYITMMVMDTQPTW